MGLGRVLWDTLLNWGDQTSIAGLNNAVHRKSLPKKVYWCILFLAGTYFTIDGIVAVVYNYYQYNVTTSIDLTNQPSVIFPAVSICNLNKVHCINLLEEYRFYINVTETMRNNGTKDSIVEEFDGNAEKLEGLLNMTGCRDQICATFEGYIPESSKDVEEFTKDKFLFLEARRSINCMGGPRDKECFMWYIIGDNKTVIKDFNQTNVEKALEFMKCDEVNVCNIQWGGGPGGQSIKPSICPSGPGGGQQTSNARAKRQAGPGLGPSQDGGPGQPSDDPPPVSTDFQQEAVFLRSFMNFPSEIRAGIGHQLETKFSTLTQNNVSSFITSCTYRGGSCSGSSYFHVFSTAQFGNCFTFNSAYHFRKDPYPHRKATLTGSLYGLSIEVFLDQENYMLKKLSKKAGARVVIHDPTLVPLPDEYGMDIQPNTATSIAIQLTDIERLPDPYKSNCTKGWRYTNYAINDTNARYTLAGCERYCLQKDIAQECKCFHPLLVQAAINSTFNQKPCLITPSEDNPDYVCFDDVMKAHDNLSRTCDCKVACNEIDYSGIVSTSTWPSNQYWYEMALDLGYDISNKDIKGKDALETKAKIQENYARVDVYFQTLNVKSIVQSALYPADSIVSNLGGAMSLYLGIALIMAFEIVELLWDLMVNIMSYCAISKPDKMPN